MPDIAFQGPATGYDPALYFRRSDGTLVPRVRQDATLATQTITIASGATGLSSGESALDGEPVALETPGTWVSAAITFQGSRDGSTFIDLRDEYGAEITIPAASIPTGAATRFALNPRLFLGLTHLRLRSGISGTAVNQTSSRAIVLVTRPLA